MAGQWTQEELEALALSRAQPPVVLHPLTDLRMRVNAALRDDETTVGATVEWDSPMLFAGNQASDDPQLSTVLVDECGRLWKEFHTKLDAGESVHKLVCILDLRRII